MSTDLLCCSGSMREGCTLLSSCIITGFNKEYSAPVMVFFMIRYLFTPRSTISYSPFVKSCTYCINPSYDVFTAQCLHLIPCRKCDGIYLSMIPHRLCRMYVYSPSPLYGPTKVYSSPTISDRSCIKDASDDLSVERGVILTSTPILFCKHARQ